MELIVGVALVGLVVLFVGGLRHRRPDDYDAVGWRSSMPLWLFGGWMFWGGGQDSSGASGGDAGQDFGSGDFGGGGGDLDGGGGGDAGGSF